MESALLRFARQDLAAASREGEILVAQTKRGTLTVRYCNRRYSISSLDGELFSGTLKQAAVALAALYCVQAV